MKLTLYSDYALRIMIHLATQPGKLASIRQIAGLYGVSHNHLMKIVQDLGRAGFIETVRGRNGGIRLGRPAHQIRLGALIRQTEGGGPLVDCGGCLIAPACNLPPVFAEAMQAFLAVFDRYTLADMVADGDSLRRLFQQPQAAGADNVTDRACGPKGGP